MPSGRATPVHIAKYVLSHYADSDLDELAAHLGLTVSALQNIAYKHGLKRSEKAMQEVYADFSKRMKEDNPMHKPESVNRLKRYWKDHPEQLAEVRQRMLESYSQIQRDKPSKLELKLCQYLDDLGVAYEHQVAIKDKFVVDIRVGNLIIEADGDWWHGHPRFEPLNERQIQQQKRDASRNKYLEACGYSVVRIWEKDMTKARVEALLIEYGILS